jgi:hypothetical protein
VQNGETLIEGRGKNKRYTRTLNVHLIKIKRQLKGIKGVFTDMGAGHVFVFWRVLVCRN